MTAILKILLRSGPCWDSPAFLRFYLSALEHPAARLLLLALRIKFSPQVLENIRTSPLPPLEKGALFSGAMNLFRAGGAHKTTSFSRSPLTDAALLAKVPPGGLVVETGASDGSSAVGLLDAARDREVLLTDLQSRYAFRGPSFARIFYGTDGRYISLKLPLLLLCLGAESGVPPAGAGSVSLLNPLIEENYPDVRLEDFDIFSGRLERPADAMKCANVLNLNYFVPAEIKAALANMRRGLKEGGWLFVCHNNDKYPDAEAWLAMQRSGERLLLKEEANEHELLPLLRSPGFSDLIG